MSHSTLCFWVPQYALKANKTSTAKGWPGSLNGLFVFSHCSAGSSRSKIPPYVSPRVGKLSHPCRGFALLFWDDFRRSCKRRHATRPWFELTNHHLVMVPTWLGARSFFPSFPRVGPFAFDALRETDEKNMLPATQTHRQNVGWKLQ